MEGKITMMSREESHAEYTRMLRDAQGQGTVIVCGLVGFDDRGAEVEFDETAVDTGYTDGWRPWVCSTSGRTYTSFECRPLHEL
jgi:hypothetical protein